MTTRIKFYRGIKVFCYFETPESGMTAWAVKYHNVTYGSGGEEGLLQYAERAIDALKAGKSIRAWRLES